MLTVSTFFYYILLYFMTINIIGFLFMKVDKQRAIKGEWRISERFLLLVAFSGAAIGMLIGSKVFRHKTKKNIFKFGLPLIIIFHVFITSIFLY